jgi:hypothetical protein
MALVPHYNGRCERERFEMRRKINHDGGALPSLHGSSIIKIMQNNSKGAHDLMAKKVAEFF